MVAAKVDIALSKASLAADADKFLLGDIENLGKAMEHKFVVSLISSSSGWHLLIISFC
jgi:hypothetical protein